MPMSLTSPQVMGNAAEQRAVANFRANREALDRSQPGVISLAPRTTRFARMDFRPRRFAHLSVPR